MNFTHYNLGQKSKGEVLEITLTNAANVRLMNYSNFSNYKNGKKHEYYGGYITKSPYKIVIPSLGTWHVTVDVEGLQRSTRSSLNVLSR